MELKYKVHAGRGVFRIVVWERSFGKLNTINAAFKARCRCRVRARYRCRVHGAIVER